MQHSHRSQKFINEYMINNKLHPREQAIFELQSNNSDATHPHQISFTVLAAALPNYSTQFCGCSNGSFSISFYYAITISSFYIVDINIFVTKVGNRVRGSGYPTRRGYNDSHANWKGEEIWLGSTYTEREFLLLFYRRIVVITRYTNTSGLKSMKEATAAAVATGKEHPCNN